MTEYLNRVLLGIAGGLVVGYTLGVWLPPKPDNCQARVSSAHVSLCLDSKIEKAKGLLR